MLIYYSSTFVLFFLNTFSVSLINIQLASDTGYMIFDLYYYYKLLNEYIDKSHVSYTSTLLLHTPNNLALEFCLLDSTSSTKYFPMMREVLLLTAPHTSLNSVKRQTRVIYHVICVHTYLIVDTACIFVHTEVL